MLDNRTVPLRVFFLHRQTCRVACGLMCGHHHRAIACRKDGFAEGAVEARRGEHLGVGERAQGPRARGGDFPEAGGREGEVGGRKGEGVYRGVQGEWFDRCPAGRWASCCARVWSYPGFVATLRRTSSGISPGRLFVCFHNGLPTRRGYG